MKKIIFVTSFMVLSGFLFGFSAPNAKAATVVELQAQIQQLMAQITQLQAKLNQLKPEPLTWCHTFNVNLKIGDSGTEVKALRTALTKEGFPNLEAMGGAYEFDERVASAVVGFQEKYASEILAPWGLVHGTGYVGPTTRAKLNKLYGCGVVPKLTCDSKCKTLGYLSGRCSMPGPIPTEPCTADEIAIDTKGTDCGSYVGAGVCCCSKLTPQPSITVLSPNGGETWTEGKTYKILWDQTDLEQVKINIELWAYSQDGTSIGALGKIGPYQIAIGTSAGQEYYNWTVPSGISEQFSLPVYKYKIRLANSKAAIYVGGNIYIDGDESDNYFSIVSTATITCTDSDGGKDYYVKGKGTGLYGSNKEIGVIWGENSNKCSARWDYSLNYSIHYDCCSDAAVNNQLNEAYCDANGLLQSYGYTCPYGCKDGVCISTSQPSITVISPNGGETLIDGNTYTISWRSTNVPYGSTVGLEVMGIINGSESWGYSLASSPNLPSTGSFSFTARTAPSNADFKIKAILFAAGATHYNSPQLTTDVSDNAFKIIMPAGITRSIKVISPNGGENLEAGKTYQIKWTSSGIDSSAKIEIRYRPISRSSELGGDIIITTSNAGNYNWAIPSNAAPGQYLIEMYYVTEYNIYGASDLSDSYFTIISMVPTCIDSDGGKNYYVKGYSKGKPNPNNDWTSGALYADTYDLCVAGKVYEYYCDATGYLNREIVSCFYGCGDGACKSGITAISPDAIGLKDLENQLASLVDAVSRLIEQVKNLIGR